MKLSIRHVLPCTVDEFWEAFWDPAFDEVGEEGGTVDRVVLSETVEGDVTTKVQKFTTKMKLPTVVQKAVGAEKLSYDQTSVIDMGKRQVHWSVEPPMKKDKITAKGTLTVKPHPDGCERIVDGIVEVKIFLVGGQIEQQIVNAITSGYEEATAKRIPWLKAKYGG